MRASVALVAWCALLCVLAVTHVDAIKVGLTPAALERLRLKHRRHGHGALGDGTSDTAGDGAGVSKGAKDGPEAAPHDETPATTADVPGIPGLAALKSAALRTAVPATAAPDVLRLLQLTDDSEFMDGVLEAVHAFDGGALGPCDLDFVICAKLRHPTGYVLDGLHGELRLASLTPPIETIVVRNSTLLQPLDLAAIPPTLRRVHFEGVRFQTGRPAELVFPDRRSRWREFTCTDCGIGAADLSHLPMLEHLDVSANPSLGRFDPAALPRSLQHLNLSNTGLQVEAGPAFFEALPPMLRELDLSKNGISGTAPCSLSNIEVLDLSGNRLGGHLCASMPPSVVVLNYAGNRIEGPVPDLTGFWSLRRLDLRGNRITALPPWSQLPRELEELLVAGNRLTTLPEMVDMPPSLTVLSVANNSISGGIDTSRLPPLLEVLDVSHNRFSGPFDMATLPQTIKDVLIQHNDFDGEIDPVAAPLLMARVVFHHNRFEQSLPPEFRDL